ncbi:MAG: hypothetical protein IKE62_01450 [Oscillospiraceae bacterium]|nr:hypothetical protein [Oscillospiraceae bacterium]
MKRRTRKRIPALLLALAMVVCLLPSAALADDGSVAISFDQCKVIGNYEDMGADIYYHPAPLAPGTASVEFTDLDGKMEEGMIASLGNAYVEGTNVAPVSDGYTIDAFDADWEISDEYADLDLTDCYCYWIMDDYGSYYFVIVNVPSAPVSDTLNISADDECELIGYYMDGDVYHYKGTVPLSIEKVCFVDFEPESVSMISGLQGGSLYGTNIAEFSGAYRVPYTFADSGSWEAEDGYEDFDFTDCCLYWIYDADYASTSFVLDIPEKEEEPAPFTAYDGDTELPLSVEKKAYDCTFFGVMADLYTVAYSPMGADSVTLDFGDNNYIGSGYDASGEYITGYGGTSGATSIVINASDFGNYVWIQDPWGDDYSGGDIHCVVCFRPMFTAVDHATGAALNEISVEENGYTYINYNAVEATGALYTITLPAGVEEIDFTFSDNCLAYNYKGAGAHPVVSDDTEYPGPYLDGAVSDATVGYSEYTKKTDFNSDGIWDFIQVQNLYDKMNYGGELRYAITFEYIEIPFEMTVDGVPVTGITYQAGGYTPQVWDNDLQAMVEGEPVALYIADVPEGTAEAALSFPEGVLAYNYSADGRTFIAGSYSDEESSAGITAVTVSTDGDQDGDADCIQVQTPFDSDYNSDVLYAITFTNVGNVTPPVELTAEEARDNIAAYYADAGVVDDANATWLTADMIAYANTFPDTPYDLTADQKDAAAEAAIAAIASATKPGDVSKNIIALAALGIDPRNLETADGGSLNAIEKLDSLCFDESGNVTASAANIYTLPYVIIAYQQFAECPNQIEALKASALESKDSWLDTSWGPDATSFMVLALSPYKAEAEFGSALEEAMMAIASCQMENGSISSSAASTGIAMAAAAALGQDPSVCRFVEDGNSLVDGLMAYIDESGCAFTPTSNTISTEQGFRGLIALANMAQGMESYRIFDFSRNIPQPDAVPGFGETHKMLLSDEIGLMFRVDFPDGFDTDGCFLTYSVSDGREGTVNISDATQIDDTGYWFSCFINALELADDVVPTLHYGDGETLDGDAYSAMDYMNDARDRFPDDLELNALMDALQNYGYYLSLSGCTDGNEHKGVEAAGTVADHYEEACEFLSDHGIEIDADGLTGDIDVKQSLTLNAQTVVNVFVKPADGMEITQVTYWGMGPDEEEISASGTRKIGGDAYYRYRSEKLGPLYLGELMEFDFTAQSGEVFQIYVSAMSYAKAILIDHPDDAPALTDAMTAFYLYYKAATKYYISQQPPQPLDP